jgi:hypothetical protein
MQRISTATREIDKFGPGKDGFKGGGPPNATQLESAWCDSVQEELARVIEGQGIVLDPMQLDQLKEALDSYSFDSPKVSGTMTVTGDVVVPGVFQASTTLGIVESTAPFYAYDNVFLGDTAADQITFNGTSVFLVGSPVTGTCSWHAALAVVGASGGSLSSDPTAAMTWNGPATFNGAATFTSTLTLPSAGGAAGRIYRDGLDLLRYFSSAAKYVHTSSNGARRASACADTLGAAAASKSLTTSSPMAPPVATTIEVSAQLWVRRAVSGSVEVSLSESVGGPIGTTGTIEVTETSGNQWQVVNFCREIVVDTTPRTYTVTVNGLGSNVTVTNARIVAQVKENLG